METDSISLNIRDNKRNVEWLLKESLNSFKLIQHRFNFDSTCFNAVERGEGRGGNRFQQNRTNVEANIEAVWPTLKQNRSLIRKCFTLTCLLREWTKTALLRVIIS